VANFDGDRIEAALIGAYVADAAALGFHWLYDPERIANLAGLFILTKLRGTYRNMARNFASPCSR